MCSPDALADGRAALAHLTERVHLLARFCPPVARGQVAGRQWERLVAHDLLPRGACRAQGPGSLRLFGTAGASGLRHEIDGASQARWGAVVAEAKAYGMRSPSKGDVCLFDRKTMDLVLARHQAGMRGPHWRLLASLSPVAPLVRRYCYLHGIIVADPELIPLPWLLRAAARASCDQLADPVLWDEVVRLGERAVVPIEVRYGVSEDGFTFDPRRWDTRDLEDLLFVQAALTEQIFEAVDAEQPEFFADRAGVLLAHVGSTAMHRAPLRSAG